MHHRKASLAASMPLALFIMVASVPSAAADPGRDRVVQTPQLSAPERGSLAGTLGEKQWTAGDLSRGTFSLPFPAQIPEGRGPLLLAVLPNYSPEAGLSEWGLGWSSALAIARFRLSGDVAYDAGDLLTSPWGRLAQGDDGAWYPADLKTYVRVEPTPVGWTATTQDGTRFTFAEEVGLRGPRGVLAWSIVQAEDLAGHQTRFFYEEGPNGRPFLQQVVYGREGAPTQRVSLSYEGVPHPTTRFDSGAPVILDRRVSSVAVEVRASTSAPWMTRFSYDLTYTDDIAGAAFFLHQVTKVYAAGAREPPVTLQHAAWADAFQSAAPRANAKLQAYLDTVGQHPWAGTLDPHHATFFDADGDGRTDVETSYDNSLLMQTESGWRKEALSPSRAAHPSCRLAPGSLNLARNLVRLVPGDPASYVFQVSGHGPTASRLTVCDRPGALLYEATVPGNWRLGPQTRLVDVNRDHAPDLIWVGSGQYRILPNDSAAAALRFGALRFGTLSPAVQPEVSWIQDLNGDGIADIVVLRPTGLLVWHGRGHFEFTEQGAFYNFKTRQGPYALRPSDEVYFVDANHDGLADLLVLLEGRRPILFMNNGATLQQVATPSLDRLWAQGLGAVAFGQFAESGDTELAISLKGRAHTLALDTPQTSLLTAVDDGKGTAWRLRYGRAHAQAGLRQRPAVLHAIDTVSSGKTPVHAEFTHLQAVVHSVSEQLVGFTHVAMARGQLREERSFYHDDYTAGLPLSSLRFDATLPQLQQETEQRYAGGTFRGLPFQQQVASETRLRDSYNGESMGITEHAQDWANPWCPLTKTRQSLRGTWVQEGVLADVADLRHVPHCLVRREIQRGVHTDTALDFEHAVEVQRDRTGKALQVSLPGTPELVLQRLQYDAEQRIVSSEKPGVGATRFAYDAQTGLLAKVTGPDGVEVLAAGRDPLSDALTALVQERGDHERYRQGFGFDGQERLSARWDNQHPGASINAPSESLSYRYANAERPGVVHRWLHLAKGAVREQLDVTTGDGAQLASATQQSAGWQLSGWAQTRPDQGFTSTYRGELLQVGDLAAGLDSYAPIFAKALALGTARADALGNAQSSERWVQSNVQARQSHTYAVREGALHTATTDALGRVTRTALDADRRPVWIYDGAQQTRFLFDAAGRLRRVTLPDGSKHSVAYDPQGLVSTISRDGLATIAYGYKPGTELLDTVEISDRDGQAARSMRYAYDGQGRQVETTYSARDGAEEKLVFFYDGATPDGPRLPGQRGRLTGVKGCGFIKSFEHNADGTVRRKRLQLGAWRAIDQSFTYFADGSPSASTTRVTQAGKELSRLDTQVELDALARPHTFLVNGTPLYTLRYDEHGQVAAIDATQQLEVAFSHDTVTRGLNGAVARLSTSDTLDTSDTDASLSWDRDAADHITGETLTFGDQQRDRAFGYDARGFLSTWSGQEGVHTYAYDHNGARTPDAALGLLHDKEGRLVRRGDRVFSYNAAGQLAGVDRGQGRKVEYLYDETGTRILKRVDGTPSEAYADGDVLTEGGHARLVEGHGWLLGTLWNGKLQPAFADPRGTVVLDAMGRKAWPSPYGVPGAGEPAMVYAQHPFDPDTGSYRMGFRDYDPMLGRFMTPDPLFLLQPAKCAADPLQCNLFLYGLNDPLQYSDPSGLAAQEAWGRCAASGDYQTVFHSWGKPQELSESPQAWRLRAHEQGGLKTTIQPADLYFFGSMGFQVTKAFTAAAHSMLTSRLYAAGMSEQALSSMLGQHIRVHDFEGVKQASAFLTERGIPRGRRVEWLQSYVVGTIRFELADATASGVRFFGGEATESGAFWLTSFTSLTNRANMSLPIHFNEMSGVISRRVVQGTPIIRGIAGPQVKYGNIFVGGAEQLLILDNRVPGVLF